MIFVDTSAWYGLVVGSDPNHSAAVRWIRSNQDPLLTTDYVIDEVLTLLRVRGHRQRALVVGAGFFRGSRAQIHYLTPADIHAAWVIFQRFHDKEWSFTDCTCKVVIDQQSITTAFTFDHHFHQFGTVTVVP